MLSVCRTACGILDAYAIPAVSEQSNKTGSSCKGCICELLRGKQTMSNIVALLRLAYCGGLKLCPTLTRRYLCEQLFLAEPELTPPARTAAPARHGLANFLCLRIQSDVRVLFQSVIGEQKSKILFVTWQPCLTVLKSSKPTSSTWVVFKWPNDSLFLKATENYMTVSQYLIIFVVDSDTNSRPR